MIFPTVSGSNLLRQKLTLPKDFKGRLNLVFVPFQQWQQDEVNSWIPLAQELEQHVEGVCYYELPTIQSRDVLSRTFINEGMRAGLPNPKTRERTITLYLDKVSFRRALEMPDEEHLYVLVVDHQGQVLHTIRGPYCAEAGEELSRTIREIEIQYRTIGGSASKLVS
jgi:hypothetical protein